jgi:hypothetical protein
MPEMKVKLPTFECLRCEHKWHPEKESEPKVCAYCKSPYYKSVSMQGASPQRARHARECNSPQCNGR